VWWGEVSATKKTKENVQTFPKRAGTGATRKKWLRVGKKDILSQKKKKKKKSKQSATSESEEEKQKTKERNE